MTLARIAGTVVASHKDPSLEGLKLLLLERIDESVQPLRDYVVAVDAVGAGIGEVVLFAGGSSARQTEFTKNRPADAVVMAIVDSFDVDGKLAYSKQ